MKKQDLLKGTFILVAGSVIAKFLGVFFRYPIILLLGDEGIAFYQLVFPLHMFFMGFAYGIPIAMSKLISESRAMNRNEQNVILTQGLLFMTILGGGFSCLLLAFSKEIISFLKWNPGSYYAFMGISIAPFIIGMLSVFRGYFQGMQNMYPSAISQIIEQIGRVIFGVGFAYILISRSIQLAAGGAALGTSIGGIIALIFLVFYFILTKEKNKKILKKEKRNFLKRILDIAIPISIGASVPAIMALIDSIIIPQRLAVAGFNFVQSAILYGQLTGKASVLINIPLTLSMALNTSIVPILSEHYILKNYKEINRKSQVAYRLSFAISLPSCVGLFLLSNQ
ncbi:MAG: polysaccharide biosynthesis protein, partial [Oscillospiraceae bacterium]|nr:polysaccharide biosynthesis protein [Oscillospiraceae bacterium]